MIEFDRDLAKRLLLQDVGELAEKLVSQDHSQKMRGISKVILPTEFGCVFFETTSARARLGRVARVSVVVGETGLRSMEQIEGLLHRVRLATGAAKAPEELLNNLRQLMVLEGAEYTEVQE